MRDMKKILVCINRRSPNHPSCAARGSEAIALCIEQEVASRNLPVAVERIHCLGHCQQGPTLRLAPDGRFFYQLVLQDVPRLIAEAERWIDDENQS